MPRPRPRGVRLVVAVAVAYAALFGGAFYLGTGMNDDAGVGTVGPYQPDLTDPTNPRNIDSHWHTALGVYDCDHWLGDGTGKGLWLWPAITPSGAPGQTGDPREYAGLHSHADGVIHMEPDSAADAGANATLGRYFELGGWSMSESGFDFLGVARSSGDRCDGKPGMVRWWVNGEEQRGNPADLKLFDEDVVVVALLPADAAPPGAPPSLAKAPWAQPAPSA
jgi:hypothetical protein